MKFCFGDIVMDATTKIILEPYTTVYVDAYSRKWYRPVTRTYITDTVVNNRILLRTVTGDVPAGWVNTHNSNVERR